jgi:ribosomal protein S18 acetylase RimI-like enzyme
VTTIRVVDVTDEASFARIPPCADPSFDHRTCDYWEDADRGSKAARPSWLAPRTPDPTPPRKPQTGNPFLDDVADEIFNPFLAGPGVPPPNPFAADTDPLADNPFAPRPVARPAVGLDAPRKLGLLARGLAVFGSYGKLLLVDDVTVAWSQFGPLSAYPRALRLRELYPQLPDAPLPAVITCIATTADARRQGHALRLVEAVCEDLTGRGFAAVETYPERHTNENATSAAWPDFWIRAGFAVVVEDERYPVVRREL